MPEILLICVLLIPQTVAGVLAKSMGKSFWFWFFISFLIPIISLIVLLFMDEKETESTGYELADHVRKNAAEQKN
ncbi:hypothetical protein [Pedobacter gandavensis]|uniref:DUF805 domain-containing protein n=1 Tax=Pedobacter gandavensis TaxID=2679963 RepID=A0ABR6EZ49_9SPHI|nr:hypothetical protein [Pedobacter gandavensis]MBB2150446.1 hypothetical protein [Pedobacter gandavensis]